MPDRQAGSRAGAARPIRTEGGTGHRQPGSRKRRLKRIDSNEQPAVIAQQRDGERWEPRDHGHPHERTDRHAKLCRAQPADPRCCAAPRPFCHDDRRGGREHQGARERPTPGWDGMKLTETMTIRGLAAPPWCALLPLNPASSNSAPIAPARAAPVISSAHASTSSHAGSRTAPAPTKPSGTPNAINASCDPGRSSNFAMAATPRTDDSTSLSVSSNTSRSSLASPPAASHMAGTT